MYFINTKIRKIDDFVKVVKEFLESINGIIERCKDVNTKICSVNFCADYKNCENRKLHELITKF